MLVKSAGYVNFNRRLQFGKMGPECIITATSGGVNKPANGD